MIVVPKDMAKQIQNIVRLYALSQFPAWRPFAFRFESEANVITTAVFAEQPLDIYGKMSALTYNGSEAAIGTVVDEQYTISGAFTVGNLRKAARWSIEGEEGVIARALRPTALNVYYVYSKGMNTEQMNRNLIAADGNTVVFATRHTLISDIHAKEEEIDSLHTRLTFIGCDEKIIRQSIEGLKNIFTV